MAKAVGTRFFQSPSSQNITILTILASALSLDTPIPPFRQIPRAALFRVIATEREHEEMSLEHVGETGYAVFAAMSVTSQLIGNAVEECVKLVRGIVGEVKLGWDVEKEA